MTVGLFANTNPGDNDSKVVKVFTLEEINEYAITDAEFSVMTSMTLIKKKGEYILEISGLNANGESITIEKKGDFEMEECGSCLLSKPKRQGVKVVFASGWEMCINCPFEEVPFGPVAPGPQP